MPPKIYDNIIIIYNNFEEIYLGFIVSGLHSLLPVRLGVLDQLHHRTHGRSVSVSSRQVQSDWCFRLFLAGCPCWSSSSWSWSTCSTVSEPTPRPQVSQNSTLSTPTWWPASSWCSAPSWSTPSSSPSSLWSLIRRITTSTPRGQICGTKSAWFWTIPEGWTSSQ